MNWHTIDWHLYGGLAMAAAGGLVLLGVVLGVAIGLGVLMFEVCSGRAQFARNYRRGKRRRSQPVPKAPLNGHGDRPVASILSDGASDSTAPLDRVVD